jgi:tetratricopeptide (TPR) repeat protein
VKPKVVSSILMLTLVGALPALAVVHSGGLPDFALYLKNAGLTALYRTELRTMCLEYNDPAACIEATRMLVRDKESRRAAALLDSMEYVDPRPHQASDLLRARVLVGLDEYGQALERAEAVIEEMPAKDLLVEAVLIRAECQYHLGRVDEALLNLHSIRPFVPEGRDADLPLYLGLCEEAGGNLEEAGTLLQEAEAGGSPDAAVGLLRLALKQGDLKVFFVLADEVGAGGTELPRLDVCDLAGEVGVLVPAAWQALMGPVIADSGFTIENCPETVGSLVRLAEDGEDVADYCDTLLRRPVARGSANRLRYARALSRGESAGFDTLAVLFRTASDRDLRVRCLAECVGGAVPEERGVYAGSMLPAIGGLWEDLTPNEQSEMAMLLLESGQADVGRDRLLRLAEDLRVGYDDASLFEVAAAVEKWGGRDQALPLYRALSESPIPSEQSLAADRAAYLLEKTGQPDQDVAGVVERVVEEGVSPLDLGDLFMDRLGDFKRAVSFYRRALADLPEGVSAETVELKLAEALAVRSLETGDRTLGAEALGLVAVLADTSIADAGEVLRVLKVSTDWLREDRGRAFTIIQSLGRREDLRSRDLYQMAVLLCHLFSERDANVYAQCAMTLRRLANEHPTSREAALGAFLGARLKFMAGDYVGALEAYKACREVWRNHAVTPLCEDGIGDCYLYSGGVREALDHYGGVNTSPRIAAKVGWCYGISDRPDSARKYYDTVLQQLCPPSLFDIVTLQRQILVYEQGGLTAALAGLDSPLPAIRKRLEPVREIIAAYGLGRAGYRKLGRETLSRASEQGGDLGCEALLLLSRLESDEEPEDRLARLGDGERVCKSIFGAMRLLHERAYLACSSGLPQACVKERKRYQQRFPLDREAQVDFDVHQALILYREGLGDSATAVIDGLVRGGQSYDALAYGLYRKGIFHLVEGDYSRALEAFRRVEEDYPGSDLHFDTLLKLGTAYYMLDEYDSSAAFFDLATAAENASIAENAYFNLGLALEEAGRLEAASEAFIGLAMRFPLSERFDRSLMRAAYTLEQAGKPEEAIAVYRDLLQYAEAPETAAEAMYWIGESFAEMDEPVRAACEFLRVVHLFPEGGPWTGTAAFRAGMECEKAGLIDQALIVYRENVKNFGVKTDWGRASADRLDELSNPKPAGRSPQEAVPEGAEE